MNLLYFSPVPWESYAQRPHFMVRELVRQGVERVVWVDPYPTRLPRGADLLPRTRGSDRVGAPFDLPVQVHRPRALPIEPLPGGPRLNRLIYWRTWLEGLKRDLGGPLLFGCGRPSALARQALDALAPRYRFFDAMDDYPAFYTGLSRRSMARQERRLAAADPVLLVSSRALHSKFADQGLRPLLIHNGYDMAELPSPEVPPQDRPVLGFVGTVGGWFDWDWTVGLAQALPDVSVRLIGPVRQAPPGRLPPNISLEPAIRREAAAAQVATFSAGLIPFVRSPLTEGVDPIKYYEYRALGVPVISTRFGEMRWRVGERGVYLDDDPATIARRLAAILADRPGSQDTQRFRSEHDWRNRFSGLMDLLRHPEASDAPATVPRSRATPTVGSRA